MENNLKELWAHRLFLQKFPLIGEKKPGEGNGFHDRESFDIPYFLHTPKIGMSDYNELYTIYFRDLTNYLSPLYKSDKDVFFTAIKLENCSEEYKKTFYKYLGGDRYEREKILELIGSWARQLVYNGRVALEFVSWLDNESKDFYAYELKMLDFEFIKENKKCFKQHVSYKDSENSDIKISSKIPKAKCIIINWPDDLGGFKEYKNTVKSVLNISKKYLDVTEERYDPGKALNRMKEWDMKFNITMSKWGTAMPLENTTEFNKILNFFQLKETVILIINAIIDGLKQLVFLLNQKLDEKARLEFDYEKYDLMKFRSYKEQWISGKMSFDKANEILSFR